MKKDAAVLQYAALSSSGRIRQKNEDAFSLFPTIGLFVVSDGIGGHWGGDIASRIVVEVLPRIIRKKIARLKRNHAEIQIRLQESIMELSRQIRESTAGKALSSRMGATVVLCLVRSDVAFVAHMGDSRAYLHRAARLQQLTQDHSIVALLLREGEITQEQARNHPAKGTLSRYVGMEAEVRPDIQEIEFRSGDRLLLCTDGLTNMVPDAEIAQILGDSPSVEGTCQTLINRANENGGEDNITVLLLEKI